MKIPETTTEKPYIKFIVYENGKIVLSNSKQWWGGVNAYFTGGDENGEEYEGNTCEPKDLEQYIEVYKSNKIKIIEEKIKILQEQLEKIKEINYHYE